MTQEERDAIQSGIDAYNQASKGEKLLLRAVLAGRLAVHLPETDSFKTGAFYSIAGTLVGLLGFGSIPVTVPVVDDWRKFTEGSDEYLRCCLVMPAELAAAAFRIRGAEAVDELGRRLGERRAKSQE